jgi:D-aminopeptidase
MMTAEDHVLPQTTVTLRRTMRLQVPVACLVGWLFLFACLPPSVAADPLRIYIVTDLEGASGVYRFAQTREPGNPLGEKAKEYLMGDIAAVVRGLRAAGATDIVVLDGVESGELVQCAAIAGHYGVPTIMVTGDEATCRESHRFFGPECVTVSVKRGIAREAAELYPFDETRQALYDGAKRAVAAIPNCQPYKLSLPIQAKKEYLVFDEPSGPGRRISKEGTIEDVLRLLDF